MTVYVPLLVFVPSKVSHLPPPVTALDVPPLAGETNVPEESVNVIWLFASAEANAIPPGLRVGPGVVKSTWMRSQRTWSEPAARTLDVPIDSISPAAPMQQHANVNSRTPSSCANRIRLLSI